MPSTQSSSRNQTPIRESDGEWLQTRPGERCLIRVSTADTNGAYSVVEIVSDARDRTPMHIHQNEDEHFIILEGTARIASGDKTFDWVLMFWLLVVAALATGIWSTLDRKRDNYVTLQKWFRVFIRIALAGQMITYGMDKIIPLQMPFPYLTRLLEPFHDFAPMGVLWASIGAAPAYETFAGCAEMLGGILLIFPRTTMLGALVVGLATELDATYFNPTYKDVVAFVVLIVVLLIRPQGIFADVASQKEVAA